MTSQQDYDESFLDDPWRKYRTQKTVSLILTFFSMGLGATVLGPTIVSMEILLDTDTKSISTVFSGGAAGYLTGAILCGVIYAKLNKELMFAVSLIGVGCSMACMPFSPHLVIFIAVNVLESLFMGVLEAAGPSYLLKIWEDHRYRQPLMQCIHSAWSAGAMVSPLIVRPFLTALPEAYQPGAPDNETTNGTISGDDILLNVTNIPDVSSPVGDDDDWTKEVSFVRFAFVVIASLIFISSIMFLLLFFVMGALCLDPSRKTSEKDKHVSVTAPKTQRDFVIKLLVIMCFYYFLYAWVGIIPGTLLAVFTVKGLGWPNDHGAIVTSAYYGALGISRLLAIPIAVVMSPRSMIIMDLTTVTVGIGLLFFVKLHSIVMWMAACIIGLGMGSIFPSGVLWAEGYIEITGVASSLIMAATSIGAMVGPALTGYLMDEFTYDCFVYVLFSAILSIIIVYAGAVLFARKSGVQRRKQTKSLHFQEIHVSQESEVLTSDEKQTHQSETQVGSEQIRLQESHSVIPPPQQLQEDIGNTTESLHSDNALSVSHHLLEDAKEDLTKAV